MTRAVTLQGLRKRCCGSGGQLWQDLCEGQAGWYLGSKEHYGLAWSATAITSSMPKVSQGHSSMSVPCYGLLQVWARVCLSAC